MPHRHQYTLDETQDLRVGAHVGAGEVLRAEGHVAHGAPDVAHALDRRHRDFLVGGVREPGGVHDGQVGGVGAGDGDVASR